MGWVLLCCALKSGGLGVSEAREERAIREEDVALYGGGASIYSEGQPRDAIVAEKNRELVEFLERWGGQLYTLLTRVTLREGAAEDLMQDLFLRLNDSEAFKASDNKTAYAQRAAINLALDWRRRRKGEAAGLDGASEAAAKGRSALAGMIEREELEQILDAVSKLGGCAGVAFVMRYIEQQSYEDIARTLEKEPHQVRALCSKAMGQLRSALGRVEGRAGETGVCDGQV